MVMKNANSSGVLDMSTVEVGMSIGQKDGREGILAWSWESIVRDFARDAW